MNLCHNFSNYCDKNITKKGRLSTSFFSVYTISNIALSVITNELRQRCNLDLEVFDFG